MATFYLALFVVGFALTVLSFAGGAAGHAFGDLHLGHGAGDGHGDGVALVNVGTVLAFLTWFGGVGFLLTAYSGLVAALTVLVAGIVGVAGASAVLLFMPEVVRAIGEPLSKVDKITIVSTGTGHEGAGAHKVVADVASIIAQAPALVEALAGVKVSDLFARVPGLREAAGGPPRVVDVEPPKGESR